MLNKRPLDFYAKIDLPASKSLSNRWLILTSLSSQARLNACLDQKITLHNLSNATDTLLMQDLLNKISASTESILSEVEGLSNHFKNPVEIDCKNAGTVLRFLTAYLSVMPGKWLVNGDERLSVRPISDLVDALKNLGAEISYVNQVGQLPLLIVGKPEFSGSHIKLNMQKSSQFASALMLMISKFPHGLRIDFEGEVVSKPYLEMTAKILEQCGVEIIRSEKNIILSGTPRCSSEIFIESDWSAASYFYAFVALSENGTIEFENLHSQSLQGDSIVAKWFEKFGVETIFSGKKTIITKKSKPLISALDLDFTDYPDLAQTLAVVCAALNIPAKLTGLSSLRDKETDRLQALSQELNQICAKNIIEKNSLIIHKHDELNFSKPVKTYGDHRMAMAFSVFSCLHNHVEIFQPEVVNKSFPNFWTEINKLN
jgi:3-phosphoshikimate 1-carboxyvinyltransferase